MAPGNPKDILPPPVVARAVPDQKPVVASWPSPKHIRKIWKDFSSRSPLAKSGSVLADGDEPSHPGPSAASAGPDLGVTESEVRDHLNIHRHFKVVSVEGVEITNDLPAFDEFLQYGKVTDEDQQTLWGKEVSRLVEAVTTTSALRFHGSSDLAVDSVRAHEMLTSLADRFLHALSIVSFDGESLMAEHEPNMVQLPTLERCWISLSFVCNKDEVEGDTAHDDDDGPATRPEDFFAFVNYCTAILARILLAEITDKLAAHRVLSHLAKISAKAKIVSTNIKECSQISLDGGVTESEIADFKAREENPLYGGGKPGLDLSQLATGHTPSSGLLSGGRNAETTDTPGRGANLAFGQTAPRNQWDMASKKGALRQLYFGQCGVIRLHLLDILMRLSVGLRGNNRLMKASYNSYEISSIVYRTGFGRSRTLVARDRDGDLDGSSDAEVIDIARHAFSQLDITVRHIKSNRSPGTHAAAAVGVGDSIGTRITWAHITDSTSGSESALTWYIQDQFELRSMSNVVAVIVPLRFASPVLTVRIQGALRSLSDDAYHLASVKDSHKKASTPPAQFIASFCLDTDEHRATQNQHGADDSKSLSHSLIKRNGLLSGKTVAQIGRTKTFIGDWSDADTRRQATEDAEVKGSLKLTRKRQADMDEASQTMKDWVLEEKGVKVQCRVYVFGVMAVSTLLILGGVVVGVTVGTRIPGVDPFNITTYCWVLAGFLLLVAKSIRVHEWPWNDFLHHCVVCKSVSELSSITGIHPQLIIAYLLQNEQTSFLETRGPFNVVFARKSDDGFSIDEPVSTWTLLLSGLIMAEVESVHGPALVCLDLRRGVTYRRLSARQADSSEEQTRILGCFRLDEQVIDPTTHGPRVRLAFAEGIGWSRMMGIYGNSNAVYV